MNKLPPLNAVRAFEAVARHLSVKQAAEEMHVTPAAVSYQLKSLEQAVGVKLFERGNRSIALTEAGQRAIGDVQSGFELVARGMQRARRRLDENILVISAGPAFTFKWLAPHLHEFLERYPDIDARVSANIRYSDFGADGVDVAVRFGSPPDPAFYSEKLRDELLVPLCSPSLLDEPAALRQPADLEGHTLIHDDSLNFMAEPPDWAAWFTMAGLDQRLANHGVHFNQADHALQAAMDAAGVVLGRYGLAMPDMLNGRLRVPFGPAMAVGAAFYIVAPREFADRDAVKAFIHWLRDLFQDHDRHARRFLETH